MDVFSHYSIAFEWLNQGFFKSLFRQLLITIKSTNPNCWQDDSEKYECPGEGEMHREIFCRHNIVGLFLFLSHHVSYIMTQIRLCVKRRYIDHLKRYRKPFNYSWSNVLSSARDDFSRLWRYLSSVYKDSNASNGIQPIRDLHFEYRTHGRGESPCATQADDVQTTHVT